MAHPKNKHSKARTRSRRSHHALKGPNYSDCPNCGGPTLSHRVCRHCGFYKGVEYVKVTGSSSS